MKRKSEPRGRAASFFRASYERGISYAEENRGRLVAVLGRAWAASEEEFLRRVGALAHARGKSFDEVLFWLWERLSYEGSGSLFSITWKADCRPQVETEEDEG